MSPADLRFKYLLFLSSKGRRMTRGQEMVLLHVCASHNRLIDPIDLVERLGQLPEGQRCSGSTVYRTLQYLEACNILRSSTQQDGWSVYNWVGEQQDLLP